MFCCSTQYSVKTREWQKIFFSYISDREWTSIGHKELKKLNTKMIQSVNVLRKPEGSLSKRN